MSELPKERRAIDYLERAWSQALLAMSTAEEEAGKLAQRVAQAAGWSQEEVRRVARELTERLMQQRRELERNLEDRVRQVVISLRVPRREELAELQKRIEGLTERLAKLRSK